MFLDEKRCERCGKSEEYIHLDKHHIVTKSKGGVDIVYLCRECHNWVHQNPQQARERGLYLREYKIIKNKNDRQRQSNE